MTAAERLNVEAAIDGELDAANALAFEREMAARPELRALYERHAAMRAAVGATPPEAAPAALRTRIEAMGRPQVVRRDLRRPGLAFAATLAVGFALGALAGGWRQFGADPRLGDVAAGYMRGEISGQPYDIASSDRHTVKPWLTAHVPFGAEVVDLAAQGFPLVGGRVDIVAGRATPTLVYKRREHVIALSETPLELGGRDGATSVSGYQVERWRDGERAYVAISDLDGADLAVFAAAFRAAGRSETR